MMLMNCVSTTILQYLWKCGFLSLIGLHITDLKDIGDFLGQGNMLGVAAKVNDFQYMMFYDEFGLIQSENPQNWNQSMHWDQEILSFPKMIFRI